MSVFRVEKNANYTVMSNYHLREKEMSFKAKGLLSVMLSLPDTWDYSMNGLVAISKEGITSIKNTLKELQEFGYLKIIKLHKDGRFCWEYHIFESPVQNEQDKAEDVVQLLQHQKQPIETLPIETLPIGNLPIGNPLQVSTDKLNTNKLNTKELNTNGKTTELFSIPKKTNISKPKKSHFNILVDMIDDVVSVNEVTKEKLKEYLVFRIKRGLKENQWQIILTDLKNSCKTSAEMNIEIENAIAGGYHTIIPTWKKKNTNAIRKGVGGVINTKAESIKDMTPEEKRKWFDGLVRDERGDIIDF
jgi:hypothetical protein